MRTSDYVLFVLFVIAIMLTIVDITKIQTDGYKCLRNPLSYGAGQWQESNNNVTVACSCSIGGKSVVYFNKDNATLVNNPVNFFGG